MQKVRCLWFVSPFANDIAALSKSRFDHVCQSVALFIRYIFPYELNLGCRYIFLMLLYSSDLKIRAFSENLGHAGMYTTYMPVKSLTSTTQHLIFLSYRAVCQHSKKKKVCAETRKQRRGHSEYTARTLDLRGIVKDLLSVKHCYHYYCSMLIYITIVFIIL